MISSLWGAQREEQHQAGPRCPILVTDRDKAKAARSRLAVRDDGTESTGSSTPVGSWLRWHSFNPLVR